MGIFGRKSGRDLDEEEALIEDEEREDRKLTKKFKDLKRGNRKKRKEPPKPWGKRERMIVLITASLTVLIAVFLALSSDVTVFSKFSGLKIKLPSFDFGILNPFREQTIIIEKKQ